MRHEKPSARPVVTSHIYPPIPIRKFDWCAYFEGDEEGPCGYGATEAEAIADLIDNYADEDEPSALKQNKD